MKMFLMSIGLVLALFAKAEAQNSLLHSLQFKNGTLLVDVVFTSQPELMKDSPFTLVVKDAVTGQPVEVKDQVKVVLWMPDMNHGSAPTQVQRVVDKRGVLVPGSYQVTNVFFTMGGTWEVHVQLKDAQGLIEMQSFEMQFADDEDHGGHGGHHH